MPEETEIEKPYTIRRINKTQVGISRMGNPLAALGVWGKYEVMPQAICDELNLAYAAGVMAERGAQQRIEEQMSETIEIDGVKYDVLWKTSDTAYAQNSRRNISCFTNFRGEWVIGQSYGDGIEWQMIFSLLSELAAAKERLAKLENDREDLLKILVAEQVSLAVSDCPIDMVAMRVRASEIMNRAARDAAKGAKP